MGSQYSVIIISENVSFGFELNDKGHWWVINYLCWGDWEDTFFVWFVQGAIILLRFILGANISFTALLNLA